MTLVESSSLPLRRGAQILSEVSCADGTVVWLRGELDLSSVHELSGIMASAILGDADVVVDLSDVEFMDASTVGVIIRARDFLQLRSRGLALRSPSRYAQRVLDLCGLAAPDEAPAVHGGRNNVMAGGASLFAPD